MKKQIYLADEAAWSFVSEQLALQLNEGLIVFLHGELGAGKTTFVRSVLRALGYTGRVKSPTYTLVEPYKIAANDIYHFDLYRLTSASELHQIGISDYFHEQAVCFVEWPEKGNGVLPVADLDCYIEYTAAGRNVEIIANTAKGLKVVEQLNLE
jgi:tRNA threonylcarbamoyladenosine biosynthesis protein TsaE